MEDFGTLYVVQNTPTIAENALKNYFWHNKEISETIEKSCNHAGEYLLLRYRLTSCVGQCPAF